jgi:hypothetical protein
VESEPRRAAVVARYASAALLGLTILGLTYALFDDDLGTPVPLFQEFTCRGTMELEVLNGFGEPHLQVPASGITVRALYDGATQPVYMRLFVRDAPDAPWRQFHDQLAEDGEHTFFVTSITSTTEAYADAKHLDGARCRSESPRIGARVE